MHTSIFKIPGYQGILVFHNGDWSGDVIIRFQEEVFGTWDKQNKPVKEVEIPGRLLVALSLDVAKKAVADEVTRLMDDLPNVMRLRKAGDDAVKACKAAKRSRKRRSKA